MSDLQDALDLIDSKPGGVVGIYEAWQTVLEHARLVANHPTIYYAIDTEDLGNGEKLHLLLVDRPGEYHVIPAAALTQGDTDERNPTRQTCARCVRISPYDFHSPLWKEVAGPWSDDILCVMCFAILGDERGLEWEEGIEFYPVSLAYHLAALTRGDTQ